MKEDYKVFRKALPKLVKNYKGKYVFIRKGIISNPYDTFSEAFVSAYSKSKTKCIIEKCVYDKDLKNLHF